MGALTFHIVSRKNEQLVMSPSELLELYLYGVPLDVKDGRNISSESLKLYISAAQQEIEKYLTIKLQKQIIAESKDFFLTDFKNWSQVRATYPVNKCHKMDGYINDVQQIEYPVEWLSTHITNNGIYRRSIHLIPSGSSAQSNAIVYSGITPHLGFYGNQMIPNYWRLKYCTGFDIIPAELLNFIGKLASINVFRILGDVVLNAGVSSQSIGIDGLSQSVSASGAFKNRIDGYLQDLKDGLQRVRIMYKSIEIMTM